MYSSLCDVPLFEHVCIQRLTASGSLRRRLLDLGFTPGTELSCRLIAPGGDPKAYALHGTTIALRNSDAKLVELTPCNS